MKRGMKMKVNSQSGISLVEVLVALILVTLLSVSIGVVLLNCRMVEKRAHEKFENVLKEWSKKEKIL